MRWKEGQSEPSSKLWLLLLLLLLPQSPERGSPVQGPGKKAEGYRQTRLATCGGPPCRTGVLEVVEPQGRRLARVVLVGVVPVLFVDLPREGKGATSVGGEGLRGVGWWVRDEWGMRG